ESDAGIWIAGVDSLGVPQFAISGPEIDALAPPRHISGLDWASDGRLSLGGVGDGRRWTSRLAVSGDVECVFAAEVGSDEPVHAMVSDAGSSQGNAPVLVGYAEGETGSWLWLGYHRP
ncbi:MAG: hypothetical protein GY876_02790, partial [Planctomycetes bacterium]|nr:hypothetical protein [Planctomycetota bacterium]